MVTKTPEELAEEFAAINGRYDKFNADCRWGKNAFLGGYKAASPQWISVKDRLPENRYITVLVDFKVPESNAKLYGFGYCESDNPVTWYVDHNRYDSPVEVTHWMPLPNPPEE